jgi:hypothetical protein
VDAFYDIATAPLKTLMQIKFDKLTYMEALNLRLEVNGWIQRSLSAWRTG